VQQFRAL